MRNSMLAVVALVVGVLTVAAPLSAHHGTAAYDTTTTVTVSGIVTEFRFVNPHVLVYWDVKDEAGNIQRWSGERSGPNSMARNAGWTRNTLKPGDQVTISGRQSKNGTHTMAISKIVLNGKDITGGGGDN